MRLAPADDTLPIRTFYFRLPNKAEAEEWASAIRNTRYAEVREERDALLAVKAVLTEQVGCGNSGSRIIIIITTTTSHLRGCALPPPRAMGPRPPCLLLHTLSWP